ncbi:MAG TPA: protein ndvB, partial [Candidatus Limnocylindrales bacterium]|nr:protein ndvB [Candidatus Limnocylindrales bacterium]
SLGIHPPLAVRLRRAYAHQATGAYLGSIALVTALILGIPLFVCSLIGAPTAATVALALLATVPASDLAIALVNRAVTDLLGPVTPPRLDLDDGVPTSLRTLVVVPTLLASEADAEAQVGQLEVHYLANRDGDIRFSLLSDWLDAPDEHMPGDEAILASAVAAIDRLNERHGEAPGGGARFLLFHRRRRWNAAEGRWMGWERKRGKLDQLNDLLRGSIGPDFVPGDRPSSAPPPDVRYVVTLDADTRMPRGAVGRLVGTLAHPLNRPVVDPLTRRVVRGYGILQPRITPTLPTEHEASIYQRVFSGSAGIDPYASAVSDVYQDLFGEGSFTGKGIYDVDAFREALAGRVPENALLSHDLFEGVFARAGLVTDIELFDEFPSNYLVEASRQHRWARGDWQLLPWILGRSRDATGRRARNAMPGIARWKMVDNLRRTLSAPFTVATLVAAWLAGGVPLAATWTGFILATAVIPAALPVVAGLRPRRPGISKRSHLRAVGADLAIGASQVGVGVVLLAHQAWLMADAIGRTLTRLLVTRRSLLEWTTAAQAKATHRLEAPAFYGQMRGAVAIAVAAAAGVVLMNPAAAPIAAPFVAGWLLSPAIARWLSLPRVEPGLEPLTEDDATDLRLTGRRTWRFFEAFVGPDTNALPPDNFQDDPAPLVARRTSPTNIGMYLLSAVTARDFGWIGTLEMVERIEATLATVDRLERYRGHLFNWYATDDLRRLDPMYVSTVDSGNLAGHLLTLANACRQMVDQPLPTAAALQGIGDAIALTRRASRHLRADRRGQTLTRGHLDAALASLIAADDRPVSTADWAGRLGELSTAVQTLGDVVATLAEEHGDGLHGELVSWSDAARSCVASHVRDLAVLGGVAPGTAPATAGTDGGPRLAELADADRAAGRSADGTGRPADPIPAADLVERLERIASHARRLFDEMDFGFLFDPTRKLFSIGFRALDGSLDPSYYDLLASEARLTSFLAIAKGDVPAEHWFRL